VDELLHSPLGLILGLVAGPLSAAALFSVLLARNRRELRRVDDERETAALDLAVTRERLAEREARLKEQANLVDRADARLKESFEALGAQALRRNNEQFLTLAAESFEGLLAKSQGDSEKRQQAIDAIVKPMREALEKQQDSLKDLEVKREKAYAGVEERLLQVIAAHEKLGSETRRLETALRRPDTRGRWGEVQLRNCVELAGMEEHADFEEQSTSGDTRLRPDLTVRLPGGGAIAVDAKVPLEAYLNSLEPEADRAAGLEAHASAVEGHVKALADRRYWEALEPSPEMVVLFITPESALMAALELRPELHEKAMEKRVLIATPTLLVGLLRAIAYGWQQEALAKHAREIADAGQDLYSRLATFAGHLGKVGQQLGRGVDAFNQSVGSLERMVLPSARRLKELKATRGEELKEPEPVTKDVRVISAPELGGSPAPPPESP
jgi:DNA recombination protein RmuC